MADDVPIPRPRPKADLEPMDVGEALTGRSSTNVEDRRDQSTLRGYAGGIGAELLKAVSQMPESVQYFFPPTIPPSTPLSRAAGSDELDNELLRK